MSSTTQQFDFAGHTATVIVPEKPNGKWIWKTEFLYAFDAAEQALLEEGYTRVYYEVSNRYGSFDAIRLMHRFHLELLKRYTLQREAILFGFSRGGLYAFNYAITYPEYVDKVYLDAPVLNLCSWPHDGSPEQAQFLCEYHLDMNTLKTFCGSPKDRLGEYFSQHIPTLLIAGEKDTTVPYPENGKIMAEYAEAHKYPLTVITKPDCDHHPHSLTDVTPIVDFVKGK